VHTLTRSVSMRVSLVVLSRQIARRRGSRLALDETARTLGDTRSARSYSALHSSTPGTPRIIPARNAAERVGLVGRRIGAADATRADDAADGAYAACIGAGCAALFARELSTLARDDDAHGRTAHESLDRGGATRSTREEAQYANEEERSVMLLQSSRSVRVALMKHAIHADASLLYCALLRARVAVSVCQSRCVSAARLATITPCNSRRSIGS
jgi:hypothetical protein